MVCQSKCWSARKKDKPYKDEDKPWRKGNIYLKKKKNDVMSALFNLLKETVPSRKNSEQQQL